MRRSPAMSGLSEAQIDAVRRGGAAAAVLGEAGAAVLAYTEDLVKNVRASDATLSAVRAHLNDTQLVDLTLVIGMYMMVEPLSRDHRRRDRWRADRLESR